MSNTTFKNVKSVDEHFSDLNVSGNAVVHERLFVKDLVATNVVHAGENEIKDVSFDVTFNAGNAGNAGDDVQTTWTHPALEVVAAEVSLVSGTLGSTTVEVGSGATAKDIFNTADPPARVSSVYSQALGESGSPSNVPFVKDGPIHARLSTGVTAPNEIVLRIKVFYYES